MAVKPMYKSAVHKCARRLQSFPVWQHRLQWARGAHGGQLNKVACNRCCSFDS